MYGVQYSGTALYPLFMVSSPLLYWMDLRVILPILSSCLYKGSDSRKNMNINERLELCGVILAKLGLHFPDSLSSAVPGSSWPQGKYPHNIWKVEIKHPTLFYGYHGQMQWDAKAEVLWKGPSLSLLCCSTPSSCPWLAALLTSSGFKTPSASEVTAFQRFPHRLPVQSPRVSQPGAKAWKPEATEVLAESPGDMKWVIEKNPLIYMPRFDGLQHPLRGEVMAEGPVASSWS